MNRSSFALAMILVSMPIPAILVAETGTWPARDTLRVGRDASADAKECLEGFQWKRSRFQVTVSPASDGRYPWLVSFPSPLPGGDTLNDRVTVEWHAVRDEAGAARHVPAIVIVHESGSGMDVGRLFARSMQAAGFHGFLVQLPHYGERRGAERPQVGTSLVRTMQQGSADVRRARDAIAALPSVDSRYIAVQGTSLGGFVVACSAALDDGFDDCFIMLAGGNLYDMIAGGQKDTADARQQLAAAGFEGQKLRDLLWQVEPTRLAHRLDRGTTWMYIAKQDTVVPLASARALASAAKLDSGHQMMLEANHYSAILHLPKILDHVVSRIRMRTKETP